MDPQKQQAQQGEARWIAARLEGDVPSMLSGAWNWARLIGEPVGFSAFAVVLSLLANLVLFRTLSQEQAGRLTLLFALLQTALFIGTLGQPSVIVRLYSQRPQGHFDWKHDLRVSVAIAIPVVLTISLLARRVYSLSAIHTGFVLIGASISALLVNASFVLSSQRLYRWAIPLPRIPNALLILPAVGFLVNRELAMLEVVLASNLLFIGLVTLIAIASLRRFVQPGRVRIAPQNRLQGLAFLASSSSSHIPEQGLVAIGGLMIAPEGLAIYAAIALLLRGFDFLANVISRVLSTELLKREDPSYANITAGLATLTFGLGSVAFLGIPVVSEWAYSGRYAQGEKLVGWLVVAGMARLLETLPRGYIIGHASDQMLQMVIYSRVAIGLAGALLAALLISRLDLMGLVSARAGIYLAQAIVGYYFFRRIRSGMQSRTASAERAATS